MAGKFYTYSNINGKVTENSGNLSDVSFSDIVDLVFNSSIDSIFDTPILIDYKSRQPARFRRASASSDFPPSSGYLTEATKERVWPIGLPGLNEDSISVTVNDGKIEIEVLKDADIDAEVKKIYDYKCLKLAKKGDKLELAYDPKTHDINTVDIQMKNGLLVIRMQPREELKPVQKHLFGAKKEEVEAKEE